MEDKEPKKEEKTVNLFALLILPLVSLFMLYKSYDRFSERDNDSGMFFLIAGLLILVAAYFFNKKK